MSGAGTDADTDTGKGNGEVLLGDVRAAVSAVRREGYKAALVYALLDGVLATLVANLAIGVVAVGVVDRPIGLLEAIDAAIPVTVTVGTVLAVGAGVLVFVGEFAARVRRPLVERFEAANPAVHEALRTARDELEAGRDTRMARALYADVIERLGATSGVRLLSLPRLFATVVLVVAVSLATVQAAVMGVAVSPSDPFGSVGGGTDAAVDGVPAGGSTPTPGGLAAGEDVLGEPEDVSAGSENLSALVSSGSAAGGGDRERSYDASGYESDPGGVEAQRAGYVPPDEVENAELIKEYNLRIREDQDG